MKALKSERTSAVRNKNAHCSVTISGQVSLLKLIREEFAEEQRFSLGSIKTQEKTFASF